MVNVHVEEAHTRHHRRHARHHRRIPKEIKEFVRSLEMRECDTKLVKRNIHSPRTGIVFDLYKFDCDKRTKERIAEEVAERFGIPVDEAMKIVNRLWMYIKVKGRR